MVDYFLVDLTPQSETHRNHLILFEKWWVVAKLLPTLRLLFIFHPNEKRYNNDSFTIHNSQLMILYFIKSGNAISSKRSRVSLPRDAVTDRFNPPFI